MLISGNSAGKVGASGGVVVGQVQPPAFARRLMFEDVEEVTVEAVAASQVAADSQVAAASQVAADSQVAVPELEAPAASAATLQATSATITAISSIDGGVKFVTSTSVITLPEDDDLKMNEEKFALKNLISGEQTLFDWKIGFNPLRFAGPSRSVFQIAFDF
jgi:hypothetical protein